MLAIFVLTFIIAGVCMFFKSKPGIALVNGAWTAMKIFLAFLAVVAFVGCFAPDVKHEPYEETPPEAVNLN